MKSEKENKREGAEQCADLKHTGVSPKEAVHIARHVTWVGFWINAILGVAKVAGGIFARSSALVADGIHSFSDFLSDIIVIVMVGISRKHPDNSHQFGHGRFETLATILLSLILIIVGIGIFYEGIRDVIAVAKGAVLPRPGFIAIIILLASILSKEWLYHYTRRAGERIHSEAVVANAWHHRSDSFSSIATLIGVGGAMFLGEKWRILDPIAAMVVAIFIIGVALKMARPAIDELLGASLPADLRMGIEKTLSETPGVHRWHALRTFKSGNDAVIEVHVKVDPEINVREAHKIATHAEHRIKNLVKGSSGMSTHVTTHIEPDE